VSQPRKVARSVRANRPSPSARYGLQTQRPDPHPTSQKRLSGSTDQRTQEKIISLRAHHRTALTKRFAESVAEEHRAANLAVRAPCVVSSVRTGALTARVVRRSA